MPAFGGIFQGLPLIGNHNTNNADQRVGNRRGHGHDHDEKSWSKSRGHKSHGRKRGHKG